MEAQQGGKEGQEVGVTSTKMYRTASLSVPSRWMVELQRTSMPQQLKSVDEDAHVGRRDKDEFGRKFQSEKNSRVK